METIIITEGVTLTASSNVIEAFLRMRQEAEAERELRAWLQSHDSSDKEWSDIYKDVYGVRPRW